MAPGTGGVRMAQYRRRALVFLQQHLRHVLAVVASAALVLCITFFLMKVPKWQLGPWQARLDAKDFLQLENSIRATWAQILGGVALLVGIYLTWRRVAAAERTVEISQEGQITERFTRVIEQLGSDKLEVRLGGFMPLRELPGTPRKTIGQSWKCSLLMFGSELLGREIKVQGVMRSLVLKFKQFSPFSDADPHLPKGGGSTPQFKPYESLAEEPHRGQLGGRKPLESKSRTGEPLGRGPHRSGPHRSRTLESESPESGSLGSKTLGSEPLQSRPPRS